MAYKGVLFDLDGTLIDSMKDNFLAWKSSLEKENIIIKEEDYYPLEGLQVEEIARILLKKDEACNKKIKEIVRNKNEKYREISQIKFYEGVEEFIDLLKKLNFYIAIVSASPYEKLHNTLPREFLEKFDCLVSGDCAERGKPFPEPFLKAAEELNLNPYECIVIENSPIGVESAKNAKMFCIGIGSTVPKEKLEKADIFIEKFSDLNIQFLKILNREIL